MKSTFSALILYGILFFIALIKQMNLRRGNVTIEINYLCVILVSGFCKGSIKKYNGPLLLHLLILWL